MAMMRPNDEQQGRPEGKGRSGVSLAVAGCFAVLASVSAMAQAAPAGVLPSSPALSPGQIQSPGVTLLPGKAAISPGGMAGAGASGGTSAASGPVITLDEALTRARANEPGFNAALAASKNAALDRSISRAALLPSVVYHNQFLYTQPGPSTLTAVTNPNGSTTTTSAPSVRFIANNTVHEYVSQGVATETLGLQQLMELSRANALAAVAKAELEISRRGLSSTVIGLFYASSMAQSKVMIQQRALDEAQSFATQTQQREAVREAAHADVIKAQLTLQQRRRDLIDAKLQVSKARLELGVLLFADPRSPYTVVLPESAAPPARAAFDAAANTNNPELQSATAGLQASSLGVSAAQGAYFPELSLNYQYGIDASHFRINNPPSVTGANDGYRNLGYAATATLDIPVFDWFATPNRIRQARILRDAAKTILSSAQRTLIARVETYYAEAEAAYSQQESLKLTVITAEESLRLTRLRYTAGEATVLEVVDAQNTLTTAELAMTDGTVRYQLALANLQTLTGTI